jgi:sortase (surface protein transpeptidase)
MRPSLAVVVLLASLLGLVPPGGAPSVAAAPVHCFAETGQCAEGAFYVFWETHGGVEILGYPVSPPFSDDDGRIIQVYERAILEWHPANAPAYQVQLTRLGDSVLGEHPERSAAPAACGGDCLLFDATSHTLRGVFKRYWTRYGGLAVFGYPLTEEFEEVSPTDGQRYRVQYFERNRFEYHPERAGTRYEVQLGLLGAETLRARPEWGQRVRLSAPEYTPLPAGAPERLLIPTLEVDASVMAVSVDDEGNMAAPETAWDTTWYAPGPRPGELGSAVISGHVDFAGVGPAVFWWLRSLSAGDAVWVIGHNGSYRRFVVEEIAVYRLDQVPLVRIFATNDGIRLNLVTCAGNFDPVSRNYDQRVVVYTRLDGATG